MTPKQVTTVGLIVPPALGRVPLDAYRIFPAGVRFVAAGLGLEQMAPADYGRALRRLDSAVEQVLDQGASAVSLMGTSLSFYPVPVAHTELGERLVSVAAGRPVSTMAWAVVRALRHVGARRIAVCSAYTGRVADALMAFLADAGFSVVARAELGITQIKQLGDVDGTKLMELGARLLGDSPADALLLSCGGLDTLDVILELEKRCGRPVVSSSQAGFWDASRLVGELPTSHHPSLLFRRDETHGRVP